MNEQPRGRDRGVVHYMNYLDKLQEAGMNVIDLKGIDMKQAAHIAKENGLITADAAHLAVMSRKSISQIATEDSDFAAVVRGRYCLVPLREINLFAVIARNATAKRM